MATINVKNEKSKVQIILQSKTKTSILILKILII